MTWMRMAALLCAVAGAVDGSPEPWETAATLLVMKPESVGLASGVIVESGDRRSIIATEPRSVILTSGRFLGTAAPTASAFHPYTSRIKGYLYPGRLVSGTKTLHGLHGSTDTVQGKLLAYDRDSDLALVSIPRSGLDASPIVAEAWDAQKAGTLVSVGMFSDNLFDPKVVVASTEIVTRKESVSETPETQKRHRGLVCHWTRNSGTEGSGLFDVEGKLVGICHFVDVNEGKAYYAEPKVIRAFLDRNGIDTKGTKDRGKTQSLIASGEAKVKAGMRAEGMAELDEAARRLETMARRVETLKKELEFPSIPGLNPEDVGPEREDPFPGRGYAYIVRGVDESTACRFPPPGWFWEALPTDVFAPPASQATAERK